MMSTRLMAVISAVIFFFSAGTGEAAAQQSLSLKAGFNFIAFTLKPVHTPQSLKAEFPLIEEIYGYSAASGSFLTASEGTLATLNAGRGYIIKAAAAFTLGVAGSAAQAGNIQLKSGFNLAGFSRAPEAATTFGSLMQKYPTILGMYRWSAASGSFIQVVRNASGVVETSDGIDPAIAAGQSYFVNIAADSTLNYDGAAILVGSGTAGAKTLVSLTPSITADTIYSGTTYDLSKIKFTAAYSDGSYEQVTVLMGLIILSVLAPVVEMTYSGVSDSSIPEGTSDVVDRISAALTQDGVTKTAEILLTIRKRNLPDGLVRSTAGGGNWTDANTWIEKTVPGTANYVEISGPVVFSAATSSGIVCNGLTIKSGGRLTVGAGSISSAEVALTANGGLTIDAGGELSGVKGNPGRVRVKGGLTNAGTVSGDTDGVTLEIGGDLVQNGVFRPGALVFNGTAAAQSVSVAAEKFIRGPITIANAFSIRALTDLALEDSYISHTLAAQTAEIDMNGKKLVVKGGPVALVCRTDENSDPMIKFVNIAGIVCHQGRDTNGSPLNPVIHEAIFANSGAPITIDGWLSAVGRIGSVKKQLRFEGDVTVNPDAILCNEAGKPSGAAISGTLTINGTLTTQMGSFAIDIGKDLFQNGDFYAFSTTFNGDGEQNVSIAPNKKVTGTFYIANKLAKINALTDLATEDMGFWTSPNTPSAIVDMGQKKLVISGTVIALTCATNTYKVPKVKFINIAGITGRTSPGKIPMMHEAIFSNYQAPIVLDGSIITIGRSAGGTQIRFEGDMTVNAGAILRNETGSRSEISVTGAFKNLGTITGDSYGLHINGYSYGN